MSGQVEQLFEVDVRTMGRTLNLTEYDSDVRTTFVKKIQDKIDDFYGDPDTLVEGTLYYQILMQPYRYIVRLRFIPVSRSQIPSLSGWSFELWSPGYRHMYTLEFERMNMSEMPQTDAPMVPFYEPVSEEDEEDEGDEVYEEEDEEEPEPEETKEEEKTLPEDEEETKEEVEREVIDYTGPVFDIFMASETPMGNYYHEDPDNVIIIKELPGNPRNAVGYPRSQLIQQYTDKSALRYKCNDGLAPDVLSIYATDVDLPNPYYRLSVPEPYLIPIASMRPLLEGTHRVWVLRASGLDPIERVASHAILLRPDGRNLEGRSVNVVSAQHCQPGQTTPVMSLMPIDLATIPESVPEQGGRRKQKRNKRVTIRRRARRTTRKRKGFMKRSNK